MDWLKLFGLIFGAAETIVPIFIHNPQSQKVEAIVVTSLDHAMQVLTPPIGVVSSPTVK